MENDTNVTLLHISTRARRGMSNTKAVPAQCQLLVQWRQYRMEGMAVLPSSSTIAFFITGLNFPAKW